ncbi:ATP-binding protein [Lusitaniella coriacea]|uniref:ATP-binding protein n=1 Tax=Lusitaniella coriacea TaxID=1983105 RepID=UPI003CF92525
MPLLQPQISIDSGTFINQVPQAFEPSDFPKLRSPKVLLFLLPVIALISYFDWDRIAITRKINAAVINISGRQRMLSQRAALYGLQLVCARDTDGQISLRKELIDVLNLMEKSHNALLKGDAEMQLPGNCSPKLYTIYYEAPFYLDRQIRNFIQAGRNLAYAPQTELSQNNSHLKQLISASSHSLLQALDIAVSQYQREKEEQELAIDCYQAELYEKSQTATAVTQAKAQELGHTLNQLKKAKMQLIQAEKMSDLGQLVAGVAHEINNPLNFISGNLGYAQRYAMDILNILKLYQNAFPQATPDIQEAIEEIELDFVCEDLLQILNSMESGTQRIQDIVLSLRNFSRLDDTQTQQVDIRELLDNTFRILRYRLKHNQCDREIKIVTEYRSFSQVIDCYPGQLSQVFMNLMGNAIDALEMKGKIFQSIREKPTIWVRTEIEKENTILIRILDNGIGMSEETKAKLFQPFFTTKSLGKGTGLGLSISQQIIVERHRGSLDCHSQLQQGTEFIVKIPVQRSLL